MKNKNIPWQERILAELDEWNFVGEHAAFWWRDDDAVTATDSLQQLLTLGNQFDISIALAVIPAFMQADLAKMLAIHAGKKQGISPQILLHGYQHKNHAGEGEKKQELGNHRPMTVIVNELQQGLALLSQDLGEFTIPVLVPPWNRVATELQAFLLDAGISGLSTYAPRTAAVVAERNERQLWQVNTHIDVINWKKDKQFIGEHEAAELIVQHLQGKRTGRYDPGEPSGLLTHHLVHDEETWRFLETLLSLLDEHPAVKWLSASQAFQLKTMAVIESEKAMNPDQNSYAPISFELPPE